MKNSETGKKLRNYWLLDAATAQELRNIAYVEFHPDYSRKKDEHGGNNAILRW